MRGKWFLCALLCALLLTETAPAAQAAELQAAVATGAVTINGCAIDNSTAQYPLLVYRDITYFPMTYHLCRFLGLTTEWDDVSRTLTITRTGGTGDYVPDTGHGRKSGSVSVTRVDYPVVVNDETADGGQWPLLNYGGVTYFPLTWAFAVDAFGWDYAWSPELGLRVDSSSGTPYVTPPIVDPENPPISAGERGEGELINAASRAWATVAWDSSPEDLTVEVTGEWTLEAIREAIGKGLSEHVKGTFLEGRLTEVSIPYTFQLPAAMETGDVLKVPYTASYRGNETVLPSGTAFVPSSTSEEATASVRLGQGWQGAADAAFQARQDLYQRLAACTRIPTLTAVSGSEGYYDASSAILAAVNANLDAAGLPYRVGSMSSGSYVNPYWTKPGYSQTLDYSIHFSPKTEDAPADPLFEVTAQCTLLTVEG